MADQVFKEYVEEVFISCGIDQKDVEGAIYWAVGNVDDNTPKDDFRIKWNTLHSFVFPIYKAMECKGSLESMAKLYLQRKKKLREGDKVWQILRIK